MHPQRPRSRLGQALEHAAQGAARWTGSSWAFFLAATIIAVWLMTGPLVHFSDTWQLVINTGTTIVTFLMVFLIQRAQNKDSLAIHLKLNEIVAAVRGASNRLIDVEDLSEEELRVLHRHFQALARMAKGDSDLFQSHSVDEAESRHERKREQEPGQP